MPKRNPRPNEFRHVENKKKMTVIYGFLMLSVILVMIAQFFNGDYENVFLCLLTLVLFAMPSLIERKLSIDLPDTLEIIILLFIYAAEILGEIRTFYIQYPGWDTMLHTLNGFLCAAIGFSLVDLLNRHEKLTFRLSPAFMAITAFCFSMTVGVLWEFFEYFMDTVFLYDMQKDTILTTFSSVTLDPSNSNKAILLQGIRDVVVVYENGTHQALGLGGYLDVGLYDTMKDLFVNFIGAVVFSVLGYFYIKTRGQGRIARKFIPTLPEDSADSPSQPCGKTHRNSSSHIS